MGVNISGKGVLSGLATLVAGVVNNLNLLVTRIIGYTTVPGTGGSSYYTTTVGSNEPKLILGNAYVQPTYFDNGNWISTGSLSNNPYYSFSTNVDSFILGEKADFSGVSVMRSSGNNVWEEIADNFPTNQLASISPSDAHWFQPSSDPIKGFYIGSGRSDNSVRMVVTSLNNGATRFMESLYTRTIFDEINFGNQAFIKFHSFDSDDSTNWIGAITYGYTTGQDGKRSHKILLVNPTFDEMTGENFTPGGNYNPYVIDVVIPNSENLSINDTSHIFLANGYIYIHHPISGNTKYSSVSISSLIANGQNASFYNGEFLMYSDGNDGFVGATGVSQIDYYKYNNNIMAITNRNSGNYGFGISEHQLDVTTTPGVLTQVGPAKTIQYSFSGDNLQLVSPTGSGMANTTTAYVIASNNNTLDPNNPLQSLVFTKDYSTNSPGEYGDGWVKYVVPFDQYPRARVAFIDEVNTLREVQVSIGNQGTEGSEILAPIDVYTVPNFKTTDIDQVTIKNNSANTITYDLAVLNSGIELTDQNALINDQAILAGATATVTSITNDMTAGQRIVVLPSAVDVVEVKVYGTESNA